MKALTGLAHEPVASGEAAGDFFVADLEIHNRANSVAITSGASEFESDPLCFDAGFKLVFDETKTRALAVGLPEVEVAIVIPVGGDAGAGIVDEIQSAHGGHIGKSLK